MIRIAAVLQELSAPSAMCRRNGQWQETKVSELVVGDLIQLKGGDIIPADAKVNPPPLPLTFPAPTLYATPSSILEQPLFPHPLAPDRPKICMSHLLVDYIS